MRTECGGRPAGSALAVIRDPGSSHLVRADGVHRFAFLMVTRQLPDVSFLFSFLSFYLFLLLLEREREEGGEEDRERIIALTGIKHTTLVYQDNALISPAATWSGLFRVSFEQKRGLSQNPPQQTSPYSSLAKTVSDTHV